MSDYKYKDKVSSDKKFFNNDPQVTWLRTGCLLNSKYQTFYE